MQISAKTEYACRAVLELSIHWPNEKPLQVAEIAKHQDIPTRFLTHILIQLKSLGYVESTRGKAGGYLLAQRPENISLFDIISQFEPAALKVQASSQDKHVLAQILSEVTQELIEKLQSFTFEQMVQNYNAQRDVVMFDI